STQWSAGHGYPAHCDDLDKNSGYPGGTGRAWASHPAADVALAQMAKPVGSDPASDPRARRLGR
ncbi:hypothetical protein, partial [Actinoalloteichus caeruleus]|uniref:hypothetical protein n=1 Tax=Actinoalloteichus cyanogriseus TaxID=2893586 RepID=UPI001B80A630